MEKQIEPTDRLWSALADRYRLERVLGHGGMATVFLAEDLKHHRPVALKVLDAEIGVALGPARFLQEIEIASRLAHPHLLPLYDSGEAGGRLYYVMPYIEGSTLRERLRHERQLPLDDAIRIVCDVADGLSYAHGHGIIHRDMKPENILLQSGRAMVADFGIARAIVASATAPATETGVVIGTAAYMSPEQGSGEQEIDARSDVYSLGCVLYEILAGEPPFSGPTTQAIIARHRSERVPSLQIVRPGIPAEVQQVIDTALAKVPADRFRSVDDLSRALRGSSTGGSSRRSRPDRRRAGRRMWLIAPFVVLAVFGAGYAALQLRDGGLREDDWLLVADFTGPPNDPRLADDVRDLVTDAFRQSRFVRLFERRQLNEAMRNASVPETTFVNAVLARQLAVRSSVRGVLIGNVTQSGTADAYTVSLNVLGTDEALEIAGVTGTATRATLIETVQQLAGELREELGERRSAVAANRPLRDVTTPSFEAFRKYAASLDVVAMRNDYPAAKALLREAIALDTAFASAWAALGAMYTSTRQLDSARIAYARASAFPQRLSVAEGYRLKANIAYAMEHDLEAAVRWYELYLDEVPHSRSGRGNRAVYLTGLGRYDEALDELRTALANHPFGPELAQPTILNLAAVLTAVGRVDEARERRGQLSGAAAQYMDIMLATALSDWSGVDGIVAGMEVDRAPGFLRIQAATSHASALAARGRISAADSALGVAASSAVGEERRWYERARLLLAVAAEGRVPARSDIAPGDTSSAATMLRALWAAAAGDTISARRGLADLEELSQRDLALLGSGHALIEGWIAAQRGEWRRVVDLLRDKALEGEHEPTFLDPPDSFALRWLVATAYERLARPDSAVLHLRLVIRPAGFPPGHFSLRGIPNGFAHRKLAMNLERAGNPREAARHLELFLAAFDAADNSLAHLVSDARKLRERLAGGASVSATDGIARGLRLANRRQAGSGEG